MGGAEQGGAAGRPGMILGRGRNSRQPAWQRSCGVRQREAWYDGCMTTLQTGRLVLRAFREADLDAYARICADPEVVRYVGRPFSRAEAWLHIATMLGHWQLRGCGMWAVEERSGAALIGR